MVASVERQSDLHQRTSTLELYGKRSMAAVDDEAPLAETVREHHFHFLGLRVRHGVKVLVESRHEALAESAHDARGLHTRFMVREPLLRIEPGHADVVR